MVSLVADPVINTSGVSWHFDAVASSAAVCFIFLKWLSTDWVDFPCQV